MDLTEDTHTLSIRASADGQIVLPNADITLDKASLTSAAAGESTLYPASTFRPADGVALHWEGRARGGAAGEPTIEARDA